MNQLSQMNEEQLSTAYGKITFEMKIMSAQLQQVETEMIKRRNEAAQTQVTSNGSKPEEAKVS